MPGCMWECPKLKIRPVELDSGPIWWKTTTILFKHTNKIEIPSSSRERSEARLSRVLSLIKAVLFAVGFFQIKSTKTLWWGGGMKIKKSSGTGLTHMHLCEHPELMGKDNTTLGLLACGYSKTTLRASPSGTFLQPLPDLVTPLMGHSLSPHTCPPARSEPSERFRYW